MSLKSFAKILPFSKHGLTDIDASTDSVLNKFKLNWLTSKMARKTSQFQNKLAPGWSVNRIDSLLFAPQNRKLNSAKTPRDFKVETIRTSDGEVNAYSTGSGPMVIFFHGWGGSASQFFPLMSGLSRCGLSSLAIDHLGHGQSEAKPTTLGQSIDTTNAVIEHVRKSTNEGFAAIVGHSTGCIAIANARPALINEIPLFLISPVFNYKLFFLKRLVKLKLHPDAVKQYATRFGKTYKLNYAKFDLATRLTKYADVAIIAHEESDAESAVSNSLTFCQKNPLTRLLLTKELDHNRIINSESVWQELKSTVNYDDTTINFSDVVYQR